MIHITADAELQAKLNGLKGPVEIRDESGRVIGYFTPAEQDEQELYKRAAAELDPEEMRRRKHSGDEGLTTDQVIKRFRLPETS